VFYYHNLALGARIRADLVESSVTNDLVHTAMRLVTHPTGITVGDVLTTKRILS
jgi:hypothetical protein